MKQKQLADLFIHNTPDKQAEKILVAFTGDVMLKKLKEKRNGECGRYGWYTDACSNDSLKIELSEHMARKDPDLDDIINLAAMILCRTELYGDKA